MKIITSRAPIIHWLMGFALFSYSEISRPEEKKEYFVPFNPFDGQTKFIGGLFQPECDYQKRVAHSE